MVVFALEIKKRPKILWYIQPKIIEARSPGGFDNHQSVQSLDKVPFPPMATIA